jgi:phosphoribosyl-ATP pyrophosphohydrolase/phosphoribosyl-AMP cyclohydrolase
MLDATITARAADTSRERENSWTRRLLGDRNLRLKKVGEEAAELVVACADGDMMRAREECADLLYHALVALHAVGGSLTDVRRALAQRAAPARPGGSEVGQ